MECKKEANLDRCNCSYDACKIKGICCDCIAKHVSRRQLPACCFPNDVEKTFDRSFDKFAELVAANKI